MVRGLEPGRTVTLRDMLRRRDYEVHEQVDAEEFPRGAILYAQVVTLDGDSILLGCAPYTLPPAWAEDVIDLREEWGIKPDAPAEALAGRGAGLRALYFDLQEALLDPEPPLIENADGDPVQLTLLHYDLRCTPQEASDALLPLARGLDRDQPRQTDAAGTLVTVSFPWAREGATRKDIWADAALGQIRIDGARMEVFADSARRVDAFQRECEARLGDRAALRDTEVVDDLGELPDWTYPDDAEGEDELDTETAAACSRSSPRRTGSDGPTSRLQNSRTRRHARPRARKSAGNGSRRSCGNSRSSTSARCSTPTRRSCAGCSASTDTFGRGRVATTTRVRPVGVSTNHPLILRQIAC